MKKLLSWKKGSIPLTRKEIIKRIKRIHGSTYKYPEIKKDLLFNKKILIKCKIHGEFKQKLSSHIKGHGCQKCGKISMSLKQSRESKNTFIDRIQKIYPDYNFKKFEYINSKIKSIVICNKHGEFKAVPNNLLNRHGCPVCKINKAIQKAKNKFESTISKIHPKYDFSEFEYIDSKTKGKVNCEKHGIFLASPNSLNAAKGCPLCGIEKSVCAGLNPVKKYKNSPYGKDFGIFYKLLFIHKPTKLMFIKIGITSRTLDQRYFKNDYKDFYYQIIDIFHGTNLKCAVKEKNYKRKNKDKRFYLPPDIKFVGRTECYEYDKEQQLTVTGIRLVRDNLIKKQKGICPICNRKLIKPCLDHHHKKRIGGTGMVRGVLCSTCNIFLGKIENNSVRYCISQEELPNVLRCIATKLQEKQTLYIHPSEKIKLKKLGKREYNRIKKYYLKLYPGKRKIPEYPKSGRKTKKWIELLEKINQLHKGKKK